MTSEYEVQLYEQNERELIRENWLYTRNMVSDNLDALRRHNPETPSVIRIKPHSFLHENPDLQNSANAKLQGYIERQYLLPTLTEGHYNFSRHTTRSLRYLILHVLERAGWNTRIARSRPFNRYEY